MTETTARNCRVGSFCQSTHNQVLQLVHPLTGAARAASVTIYGRVEAPEVGCEVELDICHVVRGSKGKKICEKVIQEPETFHL